MLAVISPAKTLDFESPACWPSQGMPHFVEESQELIKICKKIKVHELQELMTISENIAKLNVERFNAWQWPFGEQARTALQAFKGDVYEGMNAHSLSFSDVKWLNDHLYILSGLYGLLKPMDAMLPYRLEMGLKLNNNVGHDLYAFWGNKITEYLNAHLPKDGILVNLASNEYFKAVKCSLLKAEVITPEFRDLKNGQYKMISFYAKRARGLMMRFMATQRIDEPQGLRDFAAEGYRYNREMSEPLRPVFTRDEPA
jgi:uncharacterized protein